VVIPIIQGDHGAQDQVEQEADKDVKGGDSVEWQQRAALKRLKQYPTMKTR